MNRCTDQTALRQKVQESMAEGGGGIKAAFEWRMHRTEITGRPGARDADAGNRSAVIRHRRG